MTKKHYIEIAKILGNNKASQQLILALSQYFKADNPRFDIERFIKFIKDNHWSIFNYKE